MDGLYLIGQGWSNGEVAARLGYKHACHFWRDFKLVHGVTPAAARRWNLSLPAALKRRPVALFHPQDGPAPPRQFW
jgi:AraC-like DNA-binding protein